MKGLVKQFLSESGMWALYDEWLYNTSLKKLNEYGRQTPEDWRRTHFSGKKGDVFFLLGSGYSVNLLKDSHWDLIGNNFSLGFNNWFFHPFVPDIYGYEVGYDPQMVQAQIKAIHAANPDLFSIPFFLHSGLASQRKFDSSEYPWKEEDVYINVPFTLHTVNERIIKKYIRKSVASEDLNKLLHYSSSLSVYLDMGIRLGYKKLVLVGVDMNDPRYFYEAPQFLDHSAEVMKNLKRIHEESGKNQTIHAVADKKITSRFGCLPVDEYIYLLQDELHKIDPEYQIYAASETSRLAEKLPVYPW
ncbi:hypothetical protein [Phaeocystidibacter marisrubri]|uniref:DUF115 domain-containing protein n=1 Tax=Phaeocystidibacter marisrubri TaxID=1577780 RepID=A0A6L3ZHS7_9FLAO|nr:hypothetical protein [Phaeocystidibacter marisrubri]KAB2817148.1 hypothetical protein F8C82_01760 [Phaeocystidibacter marisrubri]GGH76662.1 hypothetical protein GCM10011318_25260 [Phaeocystidibacter marisrubri]